MSGECAMVQSGITAIRRHRIWRGLCWKMFKKDYPVVFLTSVDCAFSGIFTTFVQVLKVLETPGTSP